MKIAVVGMQFGDEGKAKAISYILKNSAKTGVVARYGGGSNAGHTQIAPDGKEVITHVIPAGILTSGVYNMLLSDVVINPLEMVGEINDLRGSGYTVDPSNLGISDRVQLTLKYHKEFEGESEKKKGKDRIGTTMRGIGPTAVAKYGREGLRLAEFLNPESFERFLKSLSRKHGNIVGKRVSVREYMEMYEPAMEFLRPFKVDEAEILREKKDRNWLYEGAQGILLDVLYGTIPYVTTSTPHSPPSDTDERIGVEKAYITRVGGGYLPTIMTPEEEKIIRGIRGETAGAEFGATTGRPRSCGWFDAVISRFAADIGRVNWVFLTKLDRLTGFDPIKVAVAYRYKGSKLEHFPADRYVFEEAEPVYEEFRGWTEDITKIEEFDGLPGNAKEYVKRLQDMMKRKISLISVGPAAGQTIEVPTWI